MKAKLLIGILAIILLFGSVMVVTQNNSAASVEKNLTQSGDKGAEIQADLPTRNKNMFLYRVNESRDVSGGGESRQIGNTTYPRGIGHESDPTAFYHVNWYLYPTLAGNLTLNGTFSISIWAGNEGTGSGGGDFYCNLTEVKPNGNTNRFATYSSTEDYGPVGVWTLYNHSFDINHMLEKGSTLEITITMDAPNSVGLTVGYGGSVDGSMRDSNVTLPCQNYIQVGNVYTEDSEGNINSTFDPNAQNKNISIWANVTDPFGGYDIEWVNLSLYAPNGTEILTNISMQKVSGNFRSYLTEFNESWNYDGEPNGTYEVRVRAVDKQGLRNWNKTGDFLGHDVYGNHDFYIGGLPYFAHLKIIDDMGNTLPNTTVIVRKGGALFDSEDTNNTGFVNMSFGNTTYEVNAMWQDVEVTGESITIDRNYTFDDHLEIKVEVIYPEIKIEDDKNNALENARTYITHPNGTTNSSAYITDNTGRIQLDQVPAGDFGFSIIWKDKEVADTSIYINTSERYEIPTSVFHLHLQVKDNQGDALNDALVTFEYEDLGIVVSSKLTNLDGNVSTRLAGANYTLQVLWKDSVVYNENYVVSTSTTDQISVEVYHVDVNVYDDMNEPLEEAKITSIYSPTGRKISTTTTDENGHAMIKLATGEHRFEVDWMGIQVANKTDDITVNDRTIDIVASVYHFDIKAIDNTTDGNILKNASVSVSFGGDVVDTGSTSQDGIYTSRLPETDVNIEMSWKGVKVFNKKGIKVSGNDLYKATCSVYYLEVTTIDSTDKPVDDATLNLYQGGSIIANGTTDSNGIEMFRVPVENYTITADWKGVEVGEENFEVIDQRGVNSLMISCDIYYLDLNVEDMKGEPLSGATVETHLKGEVVFSYQTDDQGNVTFKLPKETFDMITTWRGFEVNKTTSVANGNKTVKITASVYHADLRPIDSQGNTTDNSYLQVKHGDETYSSGRTDNQGNYSIRIPEETYDVKVEWDGVEVYDSQESISRNGVFNLTSDIYYLTIDGVDDKNKTVNNMAVSIYHGSLLQGQDLLKTVDVKNSNTVRVPAGKIEFTAEWRGFTVATDSISVQMDIDHTIHCDIFYLNVTVVDSEQKHLNGANLILKDKRGKVYTTTSTEEGVASPRLPTGRWTANVYWNGEFVGDEDIKELNESSQITIDTDVHYIRLKISGKEGGISGVEVTLLDKNGLPVRTNKTSDDGTVQFSQIVEGDYNIRVKIKETQWMTKVSQQKTENITLDSSKELELKFDEYPRPFYKTNLFYFTLVSVLVIVIGAVLVARKKEVI